MGLSGVILKRKEDINIEQLIEDILTAAHRAGVPIIMNEKEFSKKDGRFKYVTFNLFDVEKDEEDNNMLMYLFNVSEEDYEEEFDWIRKEGKLIHIINMERFSLFEKMVLNFVYEYLCINQDDIFWAEGDLFYDYNAIKTIKNRKFDESWWYKPVTP